jgi:hypothetical protein
MHDQERNNRWLANLFCLAVGYALVEFITWLLA